MFNSGDLDPAIDMEGNLPNSLFQSQDYQAPGDKRCPKLEPAGIPED